MVDSKLVDKQVFRTLIPANSLNAENFQELASHAKLEELPTGRFLFKKGESLVVTRNNCLKVKELFCSISSSFHVHRKMSTTA